MTGLPAQEWDTLTAALMSLHHQQREISLDKRRGHRPRLAAPGTGRRPILTLADRLLATSACRCHRSPSPSCSASGPRRSTSASATSASS
jgi:hypothetical protein